MRSSGGLAGGVAALLDILLFSSIWVALAAMALQAAATQAMEIPAQPALLGLALCGTLVVYNVDRLRDQERDRATAPARTAFVTRHQRSLRGLVVVAAIGSLLLGASAGPRVVAAACGVLALGLAHRRLKRRPWAKPVSLCLAWTVVTVGLPAAAHPAASQALRVSALVALVILSNVVLSNLRDREGLAAQLGSGRARLLAGGLLLPALWLAATGAASMRGLTWLPLAGGAAVACFRPTERYGLLAVDGALLVGALLSLTMGAGAG